PLFYNACQQLMNPGGHFSVGSTSTSCKVGMQNGQVTTLETASMLPPSPFAGQKVQLRGVAPALAKSAAPASVPAGTGLSVILDNQCLKENPQAVNGTVISKAATAQNATMPDLERQAYVWPLDRDYPDSEISALAEQEPCVVGVSWNHEYKLQSVQ